MNPIQASVSQTYFTTLNLNLFYHFPPIPFIQIALYNEVSTKPWYGGATTMKKYSEESVFALSIIACIFPFLFIIMPFLENTEPYNFLVFFPSLAWGSILGSLFGILSLVCNRYIKSTKIYILSLVPICMLFLCIVTCFIFPDNMP